MKPHARIFGLDLLRAAAIGLVLFSHATLFCVSRSTLFGCGLLAGYLGVELFFVLSGFLIGGILLRVAEEEPTARGLGNFWLRRWFRTLPSYFLFIAINLGLALSYGREVPSLWQYFVFLQNFVSRPAPFFVESWSLAVEEWFYLLLPLAVFALPRRGSLRERSAAILIGGILLVTFARSIYVAVADPVWLTDVRMIVAFRLDACMFGVAGAWCYRYRPSLWQKAARPLLAFGLVLLAAIMAAPFYLPLDSMFMRTGGFTLTSLGALCLLPALQQWRIAPGLPGMAVTKVSLWSYSLYLVNYPVYDILHRHAIASAPLLAVIFAVVSIAVAAFLYRFYERPMMQLRERWALPRPTVRPSLHAVLAEP